MPQLIVSLEAPKFKISFPNGGSTTITMEVARELMEALITLFAKRVDDVRTST